MPSPVSARFDDVRSGVALAFGPPEEILVAGTHEEVGPVLAAAEERTRAGRWVHGFLSYEAGSGLDPALPRAAPPPGTPLAWFGVGGPPRSVAPVRPPVPYPRSGPWRPDRDADAHRHAVQVVRDRIAAGETYQANLTVTSRGPAPSDPFAVYAAMASEQRGSHHAYLDLGDLVIASASPELFLDREGTAVTMRPMKGTASRGPTTGADLAIRDRLARDPKERAENVMIVDLVRNDLGRVAVPGSVRVRSLCAPERYGTVWQLTSEVTAQLGPGHGWPDLFTATFPCGSITGAPKRRSMEILADLEGVPRGIYCGAIGWMGPGDVGRFSVAIRTLVVDRARGTAAYGVGGAITWDSDPAAEHAELCAKTRVLDRRSRPAGLFETFGHVDGRAPHLDRHLDRLLDSAGHFDIPATRGALAGAVEDALRGRRGTGRVRLRLHDDGAVEVDVDDGGPARRSPVRLAVDTVPIRSDDPWRRHKVVHRESYDEARGRHPDADDVVLLNERGEVVETALASLAVRLDGRWCTPPLSAGALPGVERARRLERGELTERTLRACDLARAEDLAVLSSLRGLRPAVLGGPPPVTGPHAGCHHDRDVTAPPRRGDPVPDAVRDLTREQAAKERVRASFASWAAGSGRGPVDLLAADATWTIVGNSPIAGTYPGKQAFLDGAADLVNARLAAPMVPAVRVIVADGEWVVVLFDATATAADGEPYRNTYTWYLRFGPGDEPGEIVEGIAFFDSIEVAELWRRVEPVRR